MPRNATNLESSNQSAVLKTYRGNGHGQIVLCLMIAYQRTGLTDCAVWSSSWDNLMYYYVFLAGWSLPQQWAMLGKNPLSTIASISIFLIVFCKFCSALPHSWTINENNLGQIYRFVMDDIFKSKLHGQYT